MQNTFLISDKYALTVKADALSILLITLAVILVIAVWKFMPAKL